MNGTLMFFDKKKTDCFFQISSFYSLSLLCNWTVGLHPPFLGCFLSISKDSIMIDFTQFFIYYIYTLVVKSPISVQNSILNTVFENHRKSLIQHCERSELRLHFEWTKSSLKMPKMVNLACGQTVLPDKN